jgi:diguanylate cyclase (GGDEF)-like protein
MDPADRQDSVESVHGGAVDARKPCLVIIAGSELGSSYQLTGDIVVVGRGADCDFSIDDGAASRRHLRIERRGHNDFFLEDLGSTNGTFVNGERVTARQLEDGDKILIGTSTVLKYCLRDDLEIRAQEELFAAGIKDWLTQAFNKSFFERRLTSELSVALRRRRPVSLVMFDLDHFKQVNDTYGHLVGDRVLQGSSADVAKLLRKEDLFCRYGGEEFAIIAPDTDVVTAAALAERCRAALEARAYEHDGKTLVVTASFGVATAGGAAPATVEELISRADAAVYRAKNAGRNRVEAADLDRAEVT